MASQNCCSLAPRTHRPRVHGDGALHVDLARRIEPQFQRQIVPLGPSPVGHVVRQHRLTGGPHGHRRRGPGRQRLQGRLDRRPTRTSRLRLRRHRAAAQQDGQNHHTESTNIEVFRVSHHRSAWRICPICEVSCSIWSSFRWGLTTSTSSLSPVKGATPHRQKPGAAHSYKARTHGVAPNPSEAYAAIGLSRRTLLQGHEEIRAISRRPAAQGDSGLRGAELLLFAVAGQFAVGTRVQVHRLPIFAQGKRREAAGIVRIGEVLVLIEHQVSARRQDRPGGDLVLHQVRAAVAEEPAADVDGLIGRVV
jgi:hypothetical protein